MILADDYFRDSIDNYGYTPTQDDHDRCDDLLTRVNAMYEFLGMSCDQRSGHRTRAKTDSLIARGLHAVHNDAHEQSMGVDVADDDDQADTMITDALLEQYGLFREDPGYTHTWVHLQSYPPHSGHRTFIP